MYHDSQQTDSGPVRLPSDRRPFKVPLPLTSFVGRRQELDIVRRHLLRPEVRLLTLTGPAGTGKTRLAIQAATESRDLFEDGAYFVDLAPVSDPVLLASAISRTLEIRQQRDEPIGERLKATLRDAQLLLILDNFEHVLPGAPAVAELLASCPALKIIVTSRAVLHLAPEHQVPVPPLRAPDGRHPLCLAEVAQYEAVALFVQRAQAINPNFQLTENNATPVAQICAQLDGLPLAIELAAARSKLLAPRALLARMKSRLAVLNGGPLDLPARQQTLRRALDLSHALLDEREQALFRRLAVFVGGCTLEAVGPVCNTRGDSDSEVLDDVAALVDKSMLRHRPRPDGEPRLWMLATVREYASERLAAADELEMLRRRHALYFLELTRAAEAALVGPGQARWLERLEEEHDNLSAALGWCAEKAEADIGLQMARALWRFWHVRGHQTSGRGWLAKLLALPAAAAPTGARAAALHAASRLACDQGDNRSAQAFAEEALAIWRTLDDRQGIARALVSLARIARDQGDGARAVLLLEQARPLLQAQGGGLGGAVAFLHMGRLAHDLGDRLQARALYEHSLAGFTGLGGDRAAGTEASGHLRGIAAALSGLAEVEVSLGQCDLARLHLEESWRVARQLGDRLSAACTLERAAGLLAAQGEARSALRVAGAAAALRATVGARISTVKEAKLERWLRCARLLLGEPASATAYAEGSALVPELIFRDGIVWDVGRSPEPNAAESAQPGAQATGLTRRERQVARLVARGLTNREIATSLVITCGTAANHVEHVLKKLGCKSRTQIAAWVIEHDLHDQRAPDAGRRIREPYTGPA